MVMLVVLCLLLLLFKLWGVVCCINITLFWFFVDVACDYCLFAIILCVYDLVLIAMLLIFTVVVCVNDLIWLLFAYYLVRFVTVVCLLVCICNLVLLYCLLGFVWFVCLISCGLVVISYLCAYSIVGFWCWFWLCGFMFVFIVCVLNAFDWCFC